MPRIDRINRCACLKLAACCMLVSAAHGAALSAARQTPRLVPPAAVGYLQASNTIYQGAMMAVSGGYAVPAADATGYMVVGCAHATTINDGRDYSATRTAIGLRGIFRWANGGAFTDANIGQICYVQDDQTVTTAAAATYDIPAGIIVDVDASGVWVDTESLGRVLSGSLNALAVTGNGSISGTLIVGGATTLGGGVIVTGAVSITEGSLTDSTVISADIKDGEIVNADISSGAAIAIAKIATNNYGATTVTFTSTLCTNVLMFSAQGVLTNATTNP